VLTEEAYERLKTIGESTELGSGFKIAMRDLEIRGAGNLLGDRQSGHIAAVGYDLYCQMVTEAVAEMKGEPVARPRVKLDVPTDAHLPTDYVEPRRSCASRPTAASPPSPPTPRSTTSAPSGRTATGPIPRRPRRCCGRPPARRVPPARHHRRLERDRVCLARRGHRSSRQPTASTELDDGAEASPNCWRPRTSTRH
jgi:hypothetical protein